MGSDKYQQHSNIKALLIGIGFLLVIILAEVIALLRLNNGHLVYTLDDPYIHLALAENIIHGHYGVNAGEFSAPSSTILWPFLLAPFASSPCGEYAPLFINIIAALATLFFAWKILNHSITINNPSTKIIIVSTLLIVFTLGTNLIGLIFTGMEHSLHVLIVAVIAWGLVLEAEGGKAAPWLVIAIVIGPLVRYENLAVSLPSLLYLAVRGHFKTSAISFLLIILMLGGFSFFLIHLGLGPFPTSVVAKSTVVESMGSIKVMIKNLQESLNNPRGLVLVFGLLTLVGFALFSKQNHRKGLLAAVSSCAIVLHLIAGKYGWYHRYEIYMWAFFVLISFYLIGNTLSGLLAEEKRITNLLKIIALVCLGMVLTCFAYVRGLKSLPVASNNIYEQQYQMHRFAVNYYGKPVAVNDLGYVAYKNNNYVLDVRGLSSLDAFRYGRKGLGSEWINGLAESHGVELVMIYSKWFKDLPDTWVKIGDLRLGKPKITPAEDTVAFYALNDQAYKEAVAKLRSFVKTLPAGVEFVYEKKNLTK